MRFNKQELATLATQPSNKFDKEGVLYITERQDGFFRRAESKNANWIFIVIFVSSLCQVIFGIYFYFQLAIVLQR